MGYSLSIQSSSSGDIQFNLAANANARASQRTQVLHGQNGTLTINGRSREAVIASLLNEIKHLRQEIRRDFPHPEQLTPAQRSFFQVRVRQVSEMVAEAANFIDHTYGRQIPNVVRRNYRNVLNDSTWKNYLASARNRDLYTGRPTPNLELGRVVNNPVFTGYPIFHLQTADPGRFTAAIERRFLQHYLTASRALDRIPLSLANERDIQICRSSLANARTLLDSLSSHPNHDHWQTGLAALERSFEDTLYAGLPNDPIRPTRLAPTAPAETFEQRHHVEIDRIEQLAVAVEQHIAIPELAEARTTLEQAETALAALQRSAGGSEINLMRRLQNQVAGARRDLGIEERDVSFHNLLERAGQAPTQDQANLFFNEAQSTLRAMHQPGANVRRLAMLQRNLQQALRDWQTAHPNPAAPALIAERAVHAVPPATPTPPPPPIPPAPPRNPVTDGPRPRQERFEVVHAGDIAVLRAAVALAGGAHNQEVAHRNLAPAREALARISQVNTTGAQVAQQSQIVRQLLRPLLAAERRLRSLPEHPPTPSSAPVLANPDPAPLATGDQTQSTGVMASIITRNTDSVSPGSITPAAPSFAAETPVGLGMPSNVANAPMLAVGRADSPLIAAPLWESASTGATGESVNHQDVERELQRRIQNLISRNIHDSVQWRIEVTYTSANQATIRLTTVDNRNDHSGSPHTENHISTIMRALQNNVGSLIPPISDYRGPFTVTFSSAG